LNISDFLELSAERPMAESKFFDGVMLARSCSERA
jgi:hypothetical protein